MSLRLRILALMTLGSAWMLPGCPALMSDDFTIGDEGLDPQGGGAGTSSFPPAGSPNADAGVVGDASMTPDSGSGDAGSGAAGAPPGAGGTGSVVDSGVPPVDAAGGSSGGTTGPDAEPSCFSEAPAVVLLCPSQCNGGCAGDVCRITCANKQECKEATLRCPDGMPCLVTCSGEQACEKAKVGCPALHRCDVTCGPEQGCKELAMQCGAGPCTLACDGKESCEASEVRCGLGPCSAPQYSRLHCGESCACTRT